MDMEQHGIANRRRRRPRETLSDPYQSRPRRFVSLNWLMLSGMFTLMHHTTMYLCTERVLSVPYESYNIAISATRLHHAVTICIMQHANTHQYRREVIRVSRVDGNNGYYEVNDSRDDDCTVKTTRLGTKEAFPVRAFDMCTGTTSASTPVVASSHDNRR